LRPGSSGYLVGTESYNPVFDGSRPQAIAYVGSASDAAKAIAFGRDHNVELSVRSGGHSYGGWSTGSGLVIDVSRLNAVTVDSSNGTVSVGTGTRLIDVYAGLAPHSVAVPGGSCPTVGIAGLTLGGGLGVLGRQFGLTCDNLLEADVVLASGDLVTASATQNPNLYWALRGGGGGSFGIATEFRFATHPIGSLGLFTLVWPWTAAARVIAAWQNWAPSAPDELWSNCLLLAGQTTPSGFLPVARVTGVYVGSQSALESELQPFLSAVGAQPFNRFVGTAAYFDTMMIEGGCEGDTVAECHLPSANPAGQLTRAPFAAKSDILTTKASPAAIAAMMAAVEARQSSSVLAGGGIALDALGGAINRVAPQATAFVHRDGLCTLQYDAGWSQGAPAATVLQNRTWLESAWKSMRPYVSGQAYQNYADPQLPEWAKAYYGSNLSRLEQVKATYDPDNVFHFRQSVPLPATT
jgi:FAD/FMN-containing dehydrogenase